MKSMEEGETGNGMMVKTPWKTYGMKPPNWHETLDPQKPTSLGMNPL
jgi:hypothetical protein